MLQYHHAWVILCCVGWVYIFEQGLYISALENARMLKLCSNVLLASIDTIYKFSYDWVIWWSVCDVSTLTT